VNRTRTAWLSLIAHAIWRVFFRLSPFCLAEVIIAWILEFPAPRRSSKKYSSPDEAAQPPLS
jgi:hypothetical protein